MSGIRYYIFILSLVMLVSFANAQTPTAFFNGSPISGTSLLTNLFPDASIGLPSIYAWFFRDETYTQPWINLTGAPLYPARIDPSVVSLQDGSIVLMGGIFQSAGVASHLYNDTWRSSDQGVTWVQQTYAAAWSARAHQSSVALPDGRIVLFGGSGGGFKNSTYYSADQGKTWILVNASPAFMARDSIPTVVLPDGSIVLMGGAVSNNNSVSGYYFANDTWRSVDAGNIWVLQNNSAPWAGREASGAVAFSNGDIILIGGQSSDLTTTPYHSADITFNDTWISHDNGATWASANLSCGWIPRSYRVL